MATRTVKHYEKDNKKALVVYSSDWQEYIVKFYTDDVHQKEADYHADDKDDAIGTAKAFCSI